MMVVAEQSSNDLRHLASFPSSRLIPVISPHSRHLASFPSSRLIPVIPAKAGTHVIGLGESWGYRSGSASNGFPLSRE